MANNASSVHSNVSTVDSYSSLCNEPMYQLLEKTSEDDYDTDVELDGKPGETVTEEQVYRRACEEIGVSPISYYIRHHHDAHLNLNYRCMSPKAVKALSIALVTNTAVTILDMEHDGINAEGVQYLMEMLVENCFIQTLNLSNNELRTWGVEVLCKMLPLNISLKCIKLSGNKLKCNDASYFAETLSSNFRISELDLSYNQFGDKGAEFLGQILTSQWSVGHHLINPSFLLQLSNNPITVDGAIRLLEVVRKNDKSNLEKININNVIVNENFMELLKSITHDHPQFVIETKGVGGSIVGSRKPQPDPMKVIQDYLDKHKLRLSDFFRNMDKAGNMSVPVSDFKKALQQFNIPLDLVQVEELLSKLDRDNTGLIDYRNLVDTRKRMIWHQREQLHKEETHQRKEKQKVQRVLKTLNSAMKAITPRSSVVIVPGQVKLPAIQPLKSFSSQQLSGTSLSLWHHVEMSNSSQYSVPILSNIQLYRPVSHLVSAARLGSSVQVNSVSQPDLLPKSPVTPK
ncbi:leucine-rich repeat-containing protein 74A [Rhincodon typus]|uniref:leucine-rich repeat-containing protein 74A n=1 Tax=Rhincodon typus TaxID=259920 RepID=UPI00202E4EFC|nr:leucine-rich repeat-containing protein 74A [Rhincodon typus]